MIEIISASAGSGKTYRLTEILEKGVVDRSVRPHAVLATTFTNKSAAELQERVRTRLLAAGRTTEAQQLTAARIGTVNAVCGRLVTDFAFELGLSPDIRVLDEEAATLALGRQISNVLSEELEHQLADLCERLPDFDWQDAIRLIVSAARSNSLRAADLKSSADRSWQEFKPLLGLPTQTAEEINASLLTAIKTCLTDAAKGSDKTAGTAEAVERVGKALRRLEQGHALAWSEWVALSKLKAAKASNALFEPVRIAAAAQDRHPGLAADVRRAIELVFELAAASMDHYQQHKRELGVIDFVDQESFALELLSQKHVRDQLSEQLDLVVHQP